ncbi:MAG: VOC family protein [Planctomycetota bacterium]
MKIRRGEINLYVSDIPRAVRFYMEALGLRRIPDPMMGEPDGTWDKVGSGDLTLTFFRTVSTDRAAPRGSRPGLSADMIVDDFDAALTGLRAAGAKIEHERRAGKGGFAMFEDPDGNAWEIMTCDRPAEIRHLVLNASDLRMSREFYSKKLEQTLLEDAQAFFVFRSGGIRVSVFGGGKKLNLKKGPSPNLKLMLEVEDLDAAVKKLKRRKVKFLGEISEAPGFMRYICLADPDNNLLFLAQYSRDPLLPYPEKTNERGPLTRYARPGQRGKTDEASSR